jgi:carbamoyl-phosphate synthase small subunit
MSPAEARTQGLLSAARRPGVLVLESPGGAPPAVFEGFLFGAEASAALARASSKAGRDQGYGEVVFNTSMTGYQEILTDPSYFGQIVAMTVPHVGNTGVNLEDPESRRPWCAGFVVHEFAETPSNWRSEATLEDYLREHGIPGLYGVDTRALTRHLRSLGVVRGILLPAEERGQAEALLRELPPFEGRDLIREVTTREPYRWPPAGARRDGEEGFPATARAVNGDSPAAAGDAASPTRVPTRFRVVALDFGVKWNLLRSLEHYGCEIEVLPATATAAEVLARKPEGVFLSNGPGDPAAATYAAETVRGLVGRVPMFGVCMGHQVMALALGAKTYKLKFGHRGGNQPVLDQDTRRVEISSHNHGYAVDAASLPPGVTVTHVNLNDRCVEGLRVEGKDAFSVQYHPEACPGPHDSVILFERFVKSMEEARAKRGNGT